MKTPDWSRAAWFKSSHSGGNGGCIETAKSASLVGVRDSKDAHSPILEFSRDEWAALLGDVRAGRYELR